MQLYYDYFESASKERCDEVLFETEELFSYLKNCSLSSKELLNYILDEKFKDKLVLFKGVITNIQSSCIYFLLTPEGLTFLPQTVCIRCNGANIRENFINCNVGTRLAFCGKVTRVSSVIYVEYYNSYPNSSSFYTF